MLFSSYFFAGIDNYLKKTFPELLPTGKSNKYVAKIYGFKIFGRKGSKYENMAIENEENKDENDN